MTRSLPDNTTAVRFFDAVFNGHHLTTITIRETTYWIAREVGELLEYGDKGRGLNKMLADEWAAEMEVGRHYCALTNGDLSALKAALSKMGGDTPHVISPKANSLTLLTREGLNRVLILTGKPIGVRFRDWLDGEVLPKIQDTGEYRVGAEPERQPKPLSPGPAPTVSEYRRAIDLRKTAMVLKDLGDRPTAHLVAGLAAEILAGVQIPTLARGVDPYRPQLPLAPQQSEAQPEPSIQLPLDPWTERLLAFMERQSGPINYSEIGRILFDLKGRDLDANRRIRAILEPAGYAYALHKSGEVQRRGWMRKGG